jgi:hypothetical protein
MSNFTIYDVELDNIYNVYNLDIVGNNLLTGFNVFDLETIEGVLTIELNPSAFVV